MFRYCERTFLLILFPLDSQHPLHAHRRFDAVAQCQKIRRQCPHVPRLLPHALELAVDLGDAGGVGGAGGEGFGEEAGAFGEAGPGVGELRVEGEDGAGDRGARVRAAGGGALDAGEGGLAEGLGDRGGGAVELGTTGAVAAEERLDQIAVGDGAAPRVRQERPVALERERGGESVADRARVVAVDEREDAAEVVLFARNLGSRLCLAVSGPDFHEEWMIRQSGEWRNGRRRVHTRFR